MATSGAEDDSGCPQDPRPVKTKMETEFSLLLRQKQKARLPFRSGVLEVRLILL
jgi:hypothetical protein